MYTHLKRLIDFLAAFTGLLLLSPILLITTIILKCTGEGKIFFTQQRVGHKNKEFKIWKFITMVSNAQHAKDGTITGKNDMRITPIGRFLRNSKIDEFPQLFNILKGDMSLVGPRPLMREPDFNSYPPEVQETIYDAKPGVTAIGSVVFRDEAALITQVQEEGEDAAAFKQKVIFPYKGKVEMWYNENQSLWVDIKILLLTAWTLLFPTSQLAFRVFKDLPPRQDRLKLEFDRMQQLKESVTLLALIVAVLIPLVPSPFWFWNNPQFLLMALIPALSFAYLIYRDDDIKVKVIPEDIGWLLFISLGLLSYFWAINGALVWYQAFGWLALFLWMLVFRAISVRKTAKNIMPILFSFFFLVMLLHHLLAIFIEVPIDTSWNAFFGKNPRYTACFLVSLYPYLLFLHSSHWAVRGAKVLSSIAIFYILYSTNVLWGSVAFVMVGLYYLWVNISKLAFRRVVFITVPLLFLLGSNFFEIEALNKISIPIDLKEKIAFKLYLVKSSISAFFEAPLAGVGLGNWHLAAYKLPVVDVPIFNNPDSFVRHRSHNLYTSHLLELGILGLMAFLMPILMVIKRGLLQKKQLNAFHQAAFASLLVYLITAFFYNDVNFYEYHFSSLQLLAFCALGILTSVSIKTFILSKNIKVGLLSLSILCLGWFVYSKYSYDQYRKAEDLMSANKTEEAIQQLEKVYHPIFKTANGFQDDLSYNRLITFDLARLYEKQAETTSAKKYYQLALQQAPNHELLLLSYSQFLLKHGQAQEAKKHAKKIQKIQHNHKGLNALLAEIAASE